MSNARKIATHLSFRDTAAQAVSGADLVIVGTEWDIYRDLDPSAMLKLAHGNVIIDGRNCLDADEWRYAGWKYRGLGRP
jgi:UDPglucose 6-dehydrogenase